MTRTKWPAMQAAMDGAYLRYQSNPTWSQQQFWDQLTGRERFAVFIGNMNYQVENGGFLQWWDNGYATDETVGYICTVCRGIKSDASLEVLRIVEAAVHGRTVPHCKLMNYLYDLSRAYWEVKEQFMGDCEAYFLRTWIPVLRPTDPGVAEAPTWTFIDQTDALCDGWGIFDEFRDGNFVIRARSTRWEKFTSDSEAEKWVWEASTYSELCQRALDFIRYYNQPVWEQMSRKFGGSDYLVQVTRTWNSETAEVLVSAPTREAAIEQAIEQAEAGAEDYYGDTPCPYYEVLVPDTDVKKL